MRVRSIICYFVAVMLTACNAADQEYFGYFGNGDKPTIGLRFRVKDGAVRSGVFSILSPEYPDKKEGVDYPITDVVEVQGGVSFSVKIKNGDTLMEYHYEVKIVNRDDAVMDVQLSDTKTTEVTPRAFKLVKVKL